MPETCTAHRGDHCQCPECKRERREKDQAEISGQIQSRIINLLGEILVELRNISRRLR